MGFSQEQKNKMFDNKTEKEINADYLKTILHVAGVPIKRTEPFGNEDCPCQSGLRYDMCCSLNKMTSLF